MATNNTAEARMAYLQTLPPNEARDNIFWMIVYTELRSESTQLSMLPFELHFTIEEWFADKTGATLQGRKRGTASLAFISTLVFIMLLVVGLRTWAIKKYGRRYSWLSARSFSDACIVLSAALGLAYLGCAAAFYKILNDNKGTTTDTALALSSTRIHISCRYILAAMSWIVKLGFISIFFEFHRVLSKRAKAVLYGITFITISSMVSVVVYTAYANVVAARMAKRIDPKLVSLPEQPLVLMTPEYILAVTDFVVDILLMIFTILLIRTLKLTRSEFLRALIFISPGVLTLVASLLRFLFLEGSIISYGKTARETLSGAAKITGKFQDTITLVHKNPADYNIAEIMSSSGCGQFNCDDLFANVLRRGYIMAIFTPVGAFLGVWVVCLPGLRIMMRRWKNQGSSADLSAGSRKSKMSKGDMVEIKLEDVQTLIRSDSINSPVGKKGLGIATLQGYHDRRTAGMNSV